MEKETANYEFMEKQQLISIIKSQENELIRQDSVIKEYQKHLEQVIEYNSVEKYRSTVQKNREEAGTTPLFTGKEIFNHVQNSKCSE